MMIQLSFDVYEDPSHPRYRALDLDQQQSLLDLMAALITHVFYEQEQERHDASSQQD